MSGTPRRIRVLLHLYPRRFRETFERDLLDAYRDAETPASSVFWNLLKNAVAIR